MRALPGAGRNRSRSRHLYDPASRPLAVRHRKAPSRRSNGSSITPTDFSAASSTISPIPEYEKFLGLYPDSPNRATALFYHRANRIARSIASPGRAHQLSKCPAGFSRERTGRARFLRPRGDLLQRQRLCLSPSSVSSRGGESESHPRWRFRRAILKARCLENLERKDEARDVYQQVIAVKDPNPFRDDSRFAVGAHLSRRRTQSRRAETIRSARFDETSKPSLKADATVRAGPGRARSRARRQRQTGQGNDRESRPPFCKKDATCRKPDAGAESRRSVCCVSSIKPASTRRQSPITKRARTRPRKKCDPR